MKDNELELSDIFDFAEWEKLLKSLSEVFGIAIGMTDLKSEMVVEPSGQTDFCTAVNEMGGG